MLHPAAFTRPRYFTDQRLLRGGGSITVSGGFYAAAVIFWLAVTALFYRSIALAGRGRNRSKCGQIANKPGDPPPPRELWGYRHAASGGCSQPFFFWVPGRPLSGPEYSLFFVVPPGFRPVVSFLRGGSQEAPQFSLDSSFHLI